MPLKFRKLIASAIWMATIAVLILVANPVSPSSRMVAVVLTLGPPLLLVWLWDDRVKTLAERIKDARR